MEVVVLGEGGSYYEVRRRGVEEETLDDADFGRFLRQVDILRQSALHLVIPRHLYFHEPSMSAGLSRSMRKMRPVESASIRTLFPTAAATKSEDMLNCSDTRSILNIGSDASWSCMLLVLGGAYPLPISYAMVGFEMS